MNSTENGLCVQLTLDDALYDAIYRQALARRPSHDRVSGNAEVQSGRLNERIGRERRGRRSTDNRVPAETPR
jgi:hypothetical protein